jgi:hypothetical protein
MDDICLPTLATAAQTIGVILLDLFRHDYDLVPKHAILGTIITGLTNILCQKGMILAAWGLFVIPYIVLLIAWIYARGTEIVENELEAQRVAAQNALIVRQQAAAPTCGRCYRSPCNCGGPYGTRSA